MQDDLPRTPANHQPLTPLLFLERTASVFPDHTAVIHGPLRRPYRELRDRCVQLAHALTRRGLAKGGVVAATPPPTPPPAAARPAAPIASCATAASSSPTPSRDAAWERATSSPPSSPT